MTERRDEIPTYSVTFTTTKPMVLVSASVDFDDSLNDLGWQMINWLGDCGSYPSGRAFNGMKSQLKVIIEKWLEQHKIIE